MVRLKTDRITKARVASENFRQGNGMSLEPKTTSASKARKSSRRLEAAVDLKRIAAAVREILFAIGEDPDREGLRETPDRVARMYEELFSGLRKDPAIF